MRQGRARLIWALYAIFIAYGATIPFHFAGSHDAIRERLHALPLDPFISPDTGRRLSIPDVVQNILLFLPFGALGIAASRNPMRARWWRVGLITLLGGLLSVTVEALQLLTVDRVASLADVMTNTAGAFLGAAAAKQGAGLITYGMRRLREEGLADAVELRPLFTASMALVVAAWQPFDVTLEVGTVAGKVRALEHDLWQFSVLRDEGISLLLCSLFAMALASYLASLGERNAGRKAAALGIPMVVGLEACRILISSRMPGLWDALVSAGGVALGGAIWSTARRIAWPGLWLTVLVTVTAVAAALQMWSPFEFSGEVRTFGWFPFLGYYTRTTFETLSHVIELALLYFPLGFCLSFFAGFPGWPGRPGSGRALGLALAATLLIAVPIEYGQSWVIGRYPDISDVGVSLLGAWVGVTAGRTRT